jgi:hypothetical protein
MKCLLLFIFSVLLTKAAVGPPGIEWHWSGHRVNVARQTSDGGYILGGGVTEVHDNINYWVVRLSTNGTFLWQTKGMRLGDDFEDPVQDLQQTSDGGFIALVETDPAIAGFGNEDCQVTRLNASGGVLWNQIYGANAQDMPVQIRQMPDGGFVFGANFTQGTNGNRTSTNYGNLDWWFVRLDTNGNKVAERSFGGIGSDVFKAMTLTADGGFALVGYSSSSSNGNKTSFSYGSDDFWIVRLNANGDKLWDRSFGGDARDRALSVWETNGVLVVGGVSQSLATGNKTNATKGTWIIGVDANGNKLWERALVDTNSYPPIAIPPQPALLPTEDGGFFQGDNFDFPTNYCCPSGYRVQRLDPQSKQTWEFRYFPDSFFLRTMQRTQDGGLIFGGGEDVFKLSPDALSAPPKTKFTSINSNSFEFLLLGSSNTDYAIERSLDFAVWQSISTNRLIGNQMQIATPAASNLNRAFFRARVVR